MSTTGYSVDLVAGLHGLDSAGISSASITVRFRYDSTDPYAVELTFTGLAQAVDPWLVGRDLFIEGVERASGDCDVHVATFGLVDGDVTVLTLSTPEASALFTLSTHDLIDFLGHTEELVPLGDETGRAQRELATVDWEKVTTGDRDHPSGR